MGAFNGSGTFVRSYSWVTDAANGVNITASRFDTEDNGFASGLTNCITRDGQGIPTAAIAWGNQNLTGVNALGAATFTFTGNGTVGGTLGVTGNASFSGNATVAGTLGVSGVSSFTAGVIAYNPNAGTTGGVRIAGNATSGNAILQFTDSTLAVQWGYLSTTAAGNFNLSGGLTVNGNFGATGDTSLSGTLAVTGNATIGGGLTIAGYLNVTGNINGGYGSGVVDGAGVPVLIGYRALPFTAASAGRTLALTDVGMAIPATGTINIPTNASVAFSLGDIVAVYNNSGSSISITASGGVTLRLGGSATTGTRALAQRGLVTLLKVGTDEWVALNGGVS